MSKRILFILLIVVLGSSNTIKVSAADSLQLGSFAVTATGVQSGGGSGGATPPTEPNAECHDPPLPPEGNTSLPTRPYTGSRGSAFGEIYQQLTGHGFNQRTTTEELDRTDEHLEEYHRYSNLIFGTTAYAYTKALERFGFRQGFGLSDKQELYDTFRPLSCTERIADVSPYLPTPLYFHTAVEQTISFSLGGSRLFARIYPDGKIQTETGVYHSIDYTIANPTIPPIKYGWTVESDMLTSQLKTITDQLNFSHKEKEDFINHWQSKLPQANYYQIAYVTGDEAQHLSPWVIEPSPNHEYRHYFIVKPFVDKPKNSLLQPRLSPMDLSGFAVVDWGGKVEL